MLRVPVHVAHGVPPWLCKGTWQSTSGLRGTRPWVVICLPPVPALIRAACNSQRNFNRSFIVAALFFRFPGQALIHHLSQIGCLCSCGVVCSPSNPTATYPQISRWPRSADSAQNPCERLSACAMPRHGQFSGVCHVQRTSEYARDIH